MPMMLLIVLAAMRKMMLICRRSMYENKKTAMKQTKHCSISVSPDLGYPLVDAAVDGLEPVAGHLLYHPEGSSHLFVPPRDSMQHDYERIVAVLNYIGFENFAERSSHHCSEL
mmetsp:Transcript_1954/g.2748  ORF Transcript_1954/g.2748 Transcript_1954/m.2748 type:complete len:113 (-) Transcript_1954:1320-1658(-)